MKHLKFILLAFVLTFAFSCNKDDSPEEEGEDIHQLVENFVTPDLIASLQELNFSFQDGEDQPDISGTFLFDNLLLKATNIENDWPLGTEFTTSTYTFSNLDPGNRTFDFTGVDGVGGSYGNATDTFYSGNGNNFSAYVKITATNGDDDVLLLMAFTGTISEDGIVNAEYALLMLDDHGHYGYIANGEGRLFEDGDGTASRL